MPKRAIAPIEGERIFLRLLTEADLSLTLQWRNQDHIRRWFVYSGLILSEQHQTWFQKYLERDNDFVFIIEERHTLPRPVGQVSLYNIDWGEKRAEFGRLLIGEAEAKGHGLAGEATRLLIAAAFNQFDLNEILLEVFTDNIPAIHIYQQCGFQANDQRDNLLLMTLSRANFQKE